MDKFGKPPFTYLLVMILIFSISMMFLSLRPATAQQQYNIQIRFGDAQGEECARANNCYVPSPVTISTGDTVEWTNNDNQLHTVTKDLSDDQTRSIFFTQLLKPGGKFSFTFPSTGTYHYSCRIHPWMTGEIIVEESTMPSMSNPKTVPSIQVQPQSSTNVTKTQSTNQTTQIPNWIKNNAKWWHDGVIGDSDFEKGIQYLVQHGMMKIPQSQSGTGATKIPSWVKNNAGWWASGQISDDEFVKGIQYMISNRIINVY